MNWKTKIVLLFARLNRPIDPGPHADIPALRRKADRAARLGSFLFDKKIHIASVINERADGVPVRIYNNSSAKNQRVIIYYHGGGFVLYGLDSHDRAARRLCAMNDCIVVAVDYRLAPEHPFPAANEDAFTAIKWVLANIEKHGGDPRKLIVAGDSAGATLSACMAHRCKKENIPLLAQVLIYPWVDGRLSTPSIQRNGKGYLLEKETMLWFRKQYTPRPEDHCNPLSSPYYESDFTNLAPAIILTAEFDPLLDDGRMYYEKLKAAGNKAIYRQYKGQIHGFFNIPNVSKEAMQSFRDIKEFLNQV